MTVRRRAGVALRSMRYGGDRSRDSELLRRASRRIGLQTGALVLAAFCLCAGVLLVLVLRFQHNASSATLRAAVERADDVTDPPNGTWLLVRTVDGRTTISPGAPRVLPYLPAIGKLSRKNASIGTDAHTGDGEYRILTEQRDGRIVQAALSLASEHAERTRLLEALAAAGALAILAAGGLGSIAGRRSVGPLAEALARQRTFVADASHELRTPLTHLTTRAQLLARSLRRGDTTAAAADTDRLIADGQQLSAVLEDLLLASEPANPSEWGPVALADVAAHGADAVANEAAAAGVAVSVQRNDAAANARPAAVRAPRVTLDRALIALLDNAIRHTPADGEVRVAVGSDRHWARLVVTDTGPGIPANEQDGLFDRFAHGESTHGSRRRFGLGLALVADTVQRLGGELVATSKAGEGTAMTIKLPLASRL